MRPIGFKNLNSKNLPYDAEVEYLESSGSQRIDTGITADYSVSVDLKYYMLQKSDPNIAWYNIFATDEGDWATANCRGIGCHHADNHVLFGYYDKNYKSHYFDDTDIVFRASSNGVYVNDSLIYIPTDDKWSTSTTMALFCCHRNDIYKEYCKARVYYFKCSKGTLVRDMIPVRVGEVGYMYDRVSSQLFGNSGTGAFVIGPDKNSSSQNYPHPPILKLDFKNAISYKDELEVVA